MLCMISIKASMHCWLRLPHCCLSATYPSDLYIHMYNTMQVNGDALVIQQISSCEMCFSFQILLRPSGGGRNAGNICWAVLTGNGEWRMFFDVKVITLQRQVGAVLPTLRKEEECLLPVWVCLAHVPAMDVITTCVSVFWFWVCLFLLSAWAVHILCLLYPCMLAWAQKKFGENGC